MSKPLYSARKATLFTFCLFLTGCFCLYLLGMIWPGIILLVGGSLVFRQLLRGRRFDAYLSALIYGGLFFTYLRVGLWALLLPTLFTVGTLVLLYREFWVHKVRFGDDANTDNQKNWEDG